MTILNWRLNSPFFYKKWHLGDSVCPKTETWRKEKCLVHCPIIRFVTQEHRQFSSIYSSPRAKIVTRSKMHLGRCIPEKIHKGNRYKLFLKVPCNWIIPLSKEVLLTEQVKTSHFAGEKMLHGCSSMQLKYNNGCAGPGCFPQIYSSPSPLCFLFCLKGFQTVSQVPVLAGFQQVSANGRHPKKLGEGGCELGVEKKKPEYFPPFSPPQVASLADAASPLCLSLYLFF